MKPANPQDTWDIVIGCGALDYEWWHNVTTTGDDTPAWSATITADNGNGGEVAVTVDHKAVMRAARMIMTDAEYVNSALRRECKNLIFNADEMDFDAASGDSLLQVMVLGEIVFG
jgi:hypothetical protein